MTSELHNEEHLFTHATGGTGIICGCGKEFATTALYQQHRQWHLDITNKGELHNDSELDEILSDFYNSAWVEGSNYPKSNPLFSPTPSEQKVKETKFAKKRIQAHIQAKVKEAVDTALKYPDHLLESDRTRPLYKGKFYENQRALNSMDSKRMRMWIILNG